MLKISVIIPVYNVEKYLDQCIQSVLNQSYEYFEIILVNDGSKDGSLDICKCYEQKDNRVIVVNKKNGGLSSARNAGLEIASGDYVLFIDSDDYLDDNNAILKLIQHLERNPVDVLNFHFKKYDEESNSFIKCFSDVDVDEFNNIYTYKERIRWLLCKSQYISSACNKLIKRELIYEFETGVLSEDIEWAYKLLITSKNIGICNLDFYVYRQRKGSITHSVGDKHIDDLINIVNKMIKISKEIKDVEFCEICNNYISFQYSTILINIHYTNKTVKQKYYAVLKELSYLLRYDLNLKVHKLNLINKYLGFNILFLFCDLYAKVRK